MLMRKNVNNCQQNSLVRVDGRKRCENLTSGSEFFLKKEKKKVFQTNTDTCGQGLSHLC